VTGQISKGRGTWAEGTCEPESFVVAGDKIVALLHVRVRLKDHTDWIDGRFADVHTYRNGKAVQIRTFGKRKDALEWAGAKGVEAT
jgi:ketosteroid isomerase-like protein